MDFRERGILELWILERGILGVCGLERENERDRLEVSGLKRERDSCLGA